MRFALCEVGGRERRKPEGEKASFKFNRVCMTARIDRSKVIVACAWLLGFAAYGPMLCIPPIVHIIKDEFHVSYSAVAILFSIPVAVLIALGIPGGCLGDRIGPHKAVAAGAVVMAAGSLLRGTSTGFASLLLFTALFGAGYAIMFPNLPKLMGLWFPREKVGLATGVYATGITIGGTVALAVTLPFVYPLFGTIRGTLFFWGLPAALAAVLWVVFGKDPHPSVHSDGPASQTAELCTVQPALWKSKNMWYIAFLLFLNDAHFYTWSAWTPTLLIMKGASPDLAAFIASSRGWWSLPALFLMPWVSYKIGLRKPFQWGSAFLLVIASLAAIVMPVHWGWLLMVAVGIATGGTFSMILALPLEMLPRQSAGFASGMVISIGYVGGLVGPWLAGRILDSTGSFKLALVLLAVAAVAWAIVGFMIPETGSRKHL